MASATGALPQPHMASLYVGDLHPDVTESVLFEKFQQAGPVLSIRVCRDAITRRSLGYGYVNFQNPADAERALDSMNYDKVMGKQIRIMWSQRDPTLRRSGANNIFIKNLEKDIDNKSIFDTFSLFGDILSCKVAYDEEGNSKGYGFVQFVKEEAANDAIEKVNGMEIKGRVVYVGKFLPRNVRLSVSANKFTNVFIKNFGELLDKPKLHELFSRFGTITSSVVMRDSAGKSKGFGFADYTNSADAQKAVEEMNGKKVDGSENVLYVGRAQRKSERKAEMSRVFERRKAERRQQYQGVNLYVKNIEDDVDDDKLRQAFQAYGNITSVKVMRDENGRSKGFGFVCFEKQEDAAKAVTEMANKMIGAKPLYVAIAQRKEDRKSMLASVFMSRLASQRVQNNRVYTSATLGTAGYYVTPNLPNRGAFVPAGVAQRMANSPAWTTNGVQTTMPRNQSFRGRGGLINSRVQTFHQPFNTAQSTLNRPVMPTRPPPIPNQTSTVVRSTEQPLAKENVEGIVVSGQETLTSQMLTSASPQQQKQMLGERIFTKIGSMYGTSVDAGKITGMVLEMDNSDLVEMLQDDEIFRSRVNEASQVLKSRVPQTVS